MNDSRREGGWWVFPRHFGQLPTPPGARDADGRPLPTNVAAGQVGSRVLFWAHGSAFAVTQSKDFVWLIGQLLCEATGQVVLIGEYGLTSSAFHPSQLEQWTSDYSRLCEYYGAENIIVAGDSAGGNLSLATLLAAAAGSQSALPPPAALVLLSPWLDLSDEALAAPSMASNEPATGGIRRYGRADYLPVAGVALCQEAYASAADRRAASASPALASIEALRGLARQVRGSDGQPYHLSAFLTWGTDEILATQQASFGGKLREAGIATTTYEAAGMPHDAAVLASLITNTDCGATADYSTFEPTRIWANLLTWLRGVRGWEGTVVPKGWAP